MHAQRSGISRRAFVGVGALGIGGYAAWRVLGDQDGGDVVAPPVRRPAWTYKPDGADLSLTELTLAGRTLYITADDPGTVHAVDIESGRRRWIAKVNEGGPAEPLLGKVAVAHGTAYVASKGGRVVALDVTDGRQRWATDPLGGGTALAPLAFGSTLCVLLQRHTVADDQLGLHVARKGVLCGLDVVRGRPAWRTEGDMVALRDARDGLLVAESGERLAALVPETGRERWSVPQPGSVALHSGVAYIVQRNGSKTRLVALDAGTGEERWRAGLPGPSGASEASDIALTVADGGRRIYACDVGPAVLFAFDSRDGGLYWRSTLQGPVDGVLAQVGSVVCLASSSGFGGAHRLESGYSVDLQELMGGGSTKSSGYVTAVRADDGKELWRTDRADDCLSGPTAVGNQAVVVAHGADWWAYDVRTGRPRWRVADAWGQEAPPLVGGGVLYGVGTAGIHAVRL